MFNSDTWKEGERLTREHMKKHGYKILYTNYSCVRVELDIVALYPKKFQIHNLKQELKMKCKASKSKEEKAVLKKVFKEKIKETNDLLVVTEVKARENSKFGTGAEAVTLAKQKHIIRGTEFLMKNKEFQGLNVRFDVSSVDSGVVSYIENAF